MQRGDVQAQLSEISESGDALKFCEDQLLGLFDFGLQLLDVHRVSFQVKTFRIAS